MERYDINSIPKANTAEAGALRVANSVDEKNCSCVDAAITPSNLYNVLNCRKANTAYKGNEIVACPYHTEFLLKCVQAGTTSTGSLDTTSATLGKVYTDGGVKWEVIVLPVELGGTGGKTVSEALYNLGLNTKAIFADDDITIDLNDYTQEGRYFCWRTTDNLKVINNPFRNRSTSFVLEVFVASGITYQRITSTMSQGVYTRRRNSTTWSNWELSGVDIGTVISYAGSVVPRGYLACNGAEVSRTTYADLFSAIGTTYGAGDGSTTFNLPNLEDNRFMEFANVVGVYKDAGLPNFSGEFGVAGANFMSDIYGDVEGVTSTSKSGLAFDINNAIYQYSRAKINLSNASAVYKEDVDTVQPKSLTLRACIKY